MALLPEDMGCAGTDPAGDMAVQRISENKKSLHPSEKGPRSFGGATLIDAKTHPLKAVNAELRRIFPAELKG